MSKPSLLAWEQGVDNRFNTSVDQSFEDLVGDTEQGDGAVALWVLYRFVWFWDRNYKCSSLDFGNFELANDNDNVNEWLNMPKYQLIKLMMGLLLLVTRRALLMSPKGRNASRDGLVKIGWVVYSLLFSCIFSLINC